MILIKQVHAFIWGDRKLFGKFNPIPDYVGKFPSPKSSSTPKVKKVKNLLQSAKINRCDSNITYKLREYASKFTRHEKFVEDLTVALNVYPHNQYAALGLALKLNCDRASSNSHFRLWLYNVRRTDPDYKSKIKAHTEKVHERKIKYILAIREQTIRKFLWMIFESTYKSGKRAGYVDLRDVRYINHLRKTNNIPNRLEYNKIFKT